MGSETNHFRYRCPCGVGEIDLVVTDYDNGWSRSDITTTFSCGCEGRFRVFTNGVAEERKTQKVFTLEHLPD